MSESEFFSKTEYSFLDRFADIRKIYSSATGHTEVYAARKALKRFAIKALKPEFREDPFYIGMLRKEFEIGFPLEHPGIVHTFSFEEVEGLGPCIVLEWVEGETLATHLTKRTLEEKTLRNVAKEICDALEYLESRQIVHGDIKPSNIIITADGNHAKLIDFGFADSPEYGSLKQSGGTRRYASPEQLANSEIKSSSDIFALGKVLEELPLKKERKVKSLIRKMRSEHAIERPQNAGEIRKAIEEAHGKPNYVYLFLFVFAAVALTGAFLIFQRTDEVKTNADQEEIMEQSADTVIPSRPPTETVTPVENKSTPPLSAHQEMETAPKRGDSTEVKTAKRVVHWMVLLTAQDTRVAARKLRDQGDNLWVEHTRQEMVERVNNQPDIGEELRQECLEEIDRVLVKIKNGE